MYLFSVKMALFTYSFLHNTWQDHYCDSAHTIFRSYNTPLKTFSILLMAFLIQNVHVYQYVIFLLSSVYCLKQVWVWIDHTTVPLKRMLPLWWTTESYYWLGLSEHQQCANNLFTWKNPTCSDIFYSRYLDIGWYPNTWPRQKRIQVLATEYTNLNILSLSLALKSTEHGPAFLIWAVNKDDLLEFEGFHHSNPHFRLFWVWRHSPHEGCVDFLHQ